MQNRFTETILPTLALIIMFAAKLAEGISLSCPISRGTVSIVNSCPKTEEEWIKAATAKNCSKYASGCDDPERLEYHCVINPFVNEMLEVCAYAKNVLLGYCTEYNIGGNSIEGNFRTNCGVFTENPCPEAYRSNQAFKYPGCYDLVKNSEKVIDSPKSCFSLNSRNRLLDVLVVVSLSLNS